MDDDEDDSDFDPTQGGRVRVWENPTGREPITPQEREQFKIPEPDLSSRTPEIPSGAEPPSTSRVDPRIIEALVKKFPDFTPTWPAKIQAEWFKAFDRLLTAGLK